ncbi:HlyD family secretion protein [Rhizobium sp. L1K21]|uniref:HlyD family secretion protein n=1 Tax=Rhizobium sp. L1K21 TaxID=2954933 RepID=UPI00209362E0|nr:HlyD family efflux transporter periplasmic adaptor subunit [Rhizobium sp. L1K21]MCO6185412.1 HlyD family efflux transporter periplasmic adaptor subunit [Rhizobium sp. L1K21]
MFEGLLCAIPIVSSLLSACAPDKPLATGYVEGEYVRLAPIDQARIETLKVKRGDRVAAGSLVAELESEDAVYSVNQATAALGQARSQLANLQVGSRPEEVAVIQANLASAIAQSEEAQRTLKRTADLLKRGIAAQSDYDKAQTAAELANASVQQMQANLAVSQLPARKQQIEAAKEAVKQAEASLELAQFRLQRRSLKAPADGVVDDVIRRVGELSGPSQPVVSILPDGAVKLRIYVPEKYLASIAYGKVLAVHCDGCSGKDKARITYISDGPEFTPPVIYSLDNRQKLVYLVEARPEPGSAALKPGQIVDVALEGADP